MIPNPPCIHDVGKNTLLKMKNILVCLFFFNAMSLGLLYSSTNIDLTGTWHFALDPVEHGEKTDWHAPEEGWNGSTPHSPVRWDEVEVPHDYLTDPRYVYTGTAWYRRSVFIPDNIPDNSSWRLQFSRVFQRCKVWINGTLVGEHEGGYTPFEFEISDLLIPGRYNLIVVSVNNDVRFRALPGARTPNIGREGWPNSKMYAWLNYGGILGDVQLVGNSPVYVRRQEVRSELSKDLEELTLGVDVTLQNDTSAEVSVEVEVELGDQIANLVEKFSVPGGSEKVVRLQGVIGPEVSWELWELDNPVLYTAQTTVRSSFGEHAVQDQFGIRNIEARDGRIYLNGRVVYLAGANRTQGHPVHGGLDPDNLVAHDLTLMKAAHLRFTRIQHTAPGKNLLRWADENGFLLILEVGMWGYTAEDQASEALRSQFKHEMRQMIHSSANHPSVIGWSLGNEYESWLPEGIDWTRDMAKFVREIDPTRLVTFNTLGAALRDIRENGRGEEHAFDYVDIITLSVYFQARDLPEFLDPVNELWPDKPVFFGEYGRRADQFSEEERITHFNEVFEIIRERPWICGFSYWSFNDYRSRYPGSGPDGYRRWGLVDENRTPRSLYFHIMRSLQQNEWMSRHPAP